MVDPMDALVKLQEAIQSGLVVLRTGDIYPSFGVWMDEPGGKTRVTYAQVTNGKVEAIALFVHNGHIKRVPCFQAGYAVSEPSLRGASRKCAMVWAETARRSSISRPWWA